MATATPARDLTPAGAAAPSSAVLAGVALAVVGLALTPARPLLEHPGPEAGPAAVAGGLALWMAMALPMVVDPGRPTSVVVARLARWGLAGSGLLALDVVGHALLDGTTLAGPAPGLAVVGLGLAVLFVAARGGSDGLWLRCGGPMAAMHLVGMADPVTAAALGGAMVLAAHPSTARGLGAGALVALVGAAVVAGGGA